ncbi:MAG: phenylalanine--tRNA ligase subunit beta [Bacteroidetes bacterium]|nr:phenylalanine--tRNA ligase subunit beta [Bacteroidota bacterium]MBU1718528.1 phenylalanine--tRNA ligase subunit beta [Bacteroidota bacterium]
MKISYNWLKSYVNTDLPAEEAGKILTDIGLEVEAIEKFESIKGSLKGYVVGKVKSKDKHPNADKLSVTTVDVGGERDLHIVCGAPNVAAGQTVIVALEGSIVNTPAGEFVIKNSKIRGEVSEGMICAEDEMGIGTSHEGILVLDKEYKPGTPASQLFDIEEDYTFEIGLTPNRIDAASHIGVARDFAAALSAAKYLQGGRMGVPVEKPAVDKYIKETDELFVEVIVEDPGACHRYSGVCITGVKVSESPAWLKNRLKAIGQSPINNVVDITNFVLHETGQPLHAFDADKINGKKIVVRKPGKGTPFVTLDGVERKLSGDDLMICDDTNGMCIAGVFGGVNSGVSDATTQIFLESARFNPVTIRKTARFHGLNTGASFRFERGSDPEMTLYAMKRAALLIKEIAGGKISGDIVDVYPEKILPFDVSLTYAEVNKVAGIEIVTDVVDFIVEVLDIQILNKSADGMQLRVPRYRADVTREIDVIEEVLRIYGFNNIPIPDEVRSSLSYLPSPDREKLRNLISDHLTANGFSEAMNNSLTSSRYYEGLAEFSEQSFVRLLNPLSKDLDIMRLNLLFGALENIAHNANRQSQDLALYEFGKVYCYDASKSGLKKFKEREMLAITLSGKRGVETWNSPGRDTGVFQLRNNVENVLKRLGVADYSTVTPETGASYFDFSVEYVVDKRTVARAGKVRKDIAKRADAKQDVWYAEMEWDIVVELTKRSKVRYSELPKYPGVRRDFALVVEKQVTYAEIEEIAYQTERKILKKVGLFDVYEGKNLPEGKKSYAVSFILQDEEKTLTDDRIEKTMRRLLAAFSEKLGAVLR